ncbi:MAG: hypothetical protein ACOX4H_00270 [Bacillota bacterium]|jgi:hypothetical protein|nr:hypothetical protein [Clostridia bacterium]
MEFNFSIGKEKHAVNFFTIITQEGISVFMTGGNKTHVGGVVLNIPRKSLTGTGISSDSWVIPVPGHKDVIVAEEVGQKICRETGEITAVTAGIHIDHAAPEDLDIIRQNCLEGARRIIEGYKNRT